MDWIISVSKEERESTKLAPATLQASCDAIRKNGCALLRGALTVSQIDRLREEFEHQFGDLDSSAMAARAEMPPPNPFLKVGEQRYEISPLMRGAFADPQLLGNPLLRAVLERSLDKDLCLNVFTVVVSFPGAALQHIHRDHAHLFPEGTLGTILPAYAINVAIPLIDIDLETGPTAIWPRSHVWANMPVPPAESATKLPLSRGDCMLVDYRTLHAGLANDSRKPRPILYMAYSRTWFSDEVNHQARTSLNMALETYRSLPESVRPLLRRAYSQALRAEQVSRSAGV